MRDKEFKAATVSINMQGDAQIVGFADDAAMPNEYLVLQRPLHISDQDRNLGQDTYYFEISGQLDSGYGGIQQAILYSRRWLLLSVKIITTTSSIRGPGHG